MNSRHRHRQSLQRGAFASVIVTTVSERRRRQRLVDHQDRIDGAGYRCCLCDAIGGFTPTAGSRRRSRLFERRRSPQPLRSRPHRGVVESAAHGMLAAVPMTTVACKSEAHYTQAGAIPLLPAIGDEAPLAACPAPQLWWLTM